MKKVMIGTPCYEGSLELTHVQSLFQTVDLCRNLGITITMEYVVGNSLVQTARNEIFRRAIEDNVDDLIFIDGDQGWNGQDFINLLSHQRDIIGGVVVSKKDRVMYNAKPLEGGFKPDEDGLIEVMGIGTGFMRISKRALNIMWELSEPYKYESKDSRSVFEAKVIDGNMYGEDIAFCQRWRALGEKVYIDPAITCSHVGKKEWRGNFMDYLKNIGGLQMISQKDIEKALDFLRDSAELAGSNRANRVYVEDYLKVVKSNIMSMHADKPVNAQEREAYIHPDYTQHLEAIKEAVYEDEKLRFLIDAAKAKISAWQTISKVGAEL